MIAGSHQLRGHLRGTLARSADDNLACGHEGGRLGFLDHGTITAALGCVFALAYLPVESGRMDVRPLARDPNGKACTDGCNYFIYELFGTFGA